MNTLLFLLPLSLLFLYTFISHFLRRLITPNLPPTPFPTFPILGHLHLFLLHPSLPSHRVLSLFSRLHGPLLYLHFGSRPTLLISSPDFARQCFTQNDVTFANRPTYLLNGKHFGYNFTSLAWSPYGHHWRSLRALSALHLLSGHKLTSLYNVRADEVKRMMFKLFRGFESDQCMDMRKVLFGYTYSVVTGMILGKVRDGGGLEEEAEEFREIVGEMSRVTGEANAVEFVGVLRWVGFGEVVERKMRRVQERRDRFMEKLLQKWRSESEDGDEKNLIDVLEELKKEEPETYTEQTIRNLLLVRN